MADNNQLVTVRERLQFGASEAEKALLLIGKDQGDVAIAEIVKDLSAAEVVTITKEYDMTKPSLVSAFVTDSQFVEALERFGSRWTPVSEATMSFDLRAFQDEFTAFLAPMLIGTGKGVYFHQRMKVLMNHPMGVDILIFMALGQKGYIEFLENPTHALASRGTWEEIYAEIKQLDGKIFKKINSCITEIFKDKIIDEITLSEMDFSRSVINGMILLAASHQQDNIDESEEEEVFSDL